MSIDYTPEILHVKQWGLQCWVRSAEMLFSWILFKLGLDLDIVYAIFFSNLFPEQIVMDQYQQKQFVIEFNQRALGRKLRPNETTQSCMDDLFVKIYNEFGATSFSPEVFASIMTNYLNMISKVHTFQIDPSKIDLVIDNDEIIENNGIVNFVNFKTATDNAFLTGCVKGSDQSLWNSYTEEAKLNYIIMCLDESPVLIEIPGHALLLSGYLPEKKKFIVNDSLQNKSVEVKCDSFLANLSTIVMYTRIPSKVENFSKVKTKSEKRKFLQESEIEEERIVI